MPQLIAVDWGTSSLRGARLDETGRVLEERSAPLGILNVPNGDFAGVFASLFADWMKPAGNVCLISGMAGSRQGWHEAPYVACPAGPDELRQNLRLQAQLAGREVIAIGAAALTARYTLALRQRGASVQSFGSEATWAGLNALWR